MDCALYVGNNVQKSIESLVDAARRTCVKLDILPQRGAVRFRVHAAKLERLCCKQNLNSVFSAQLSL